MYLHRIIKEIIKEAAISTKQAGKEKLALYYGTPKTAEWVTDSIYVLYSPKALIQNIEEHGFSELNPDEIIYGVIALDSHEGECNNASSVNNVAAKKGYGPLMYSIAATREKEITSSRPKGSVKKGAQNVWNYFYSKGEAQATPFDDINNPKDENPTNDCELHNIPPLDHSYSGINVPFGILLSYHKQFANSISKEIDKEHLIQILESLASNFYFDHYLSSPF